MYWASGGKGGKSDCAIRRDDDTAQLKAASTIQERL